jgi:hypothetical protein
MGDNHDQEEMEQPTLIIPLINFTTDNEFGLELKQATIINFPLDPSGEVTMGSQRYPLGAFIPIQNPKIPTDYCLLITPSKVEELSSTLLRTLVIFKLFKDHPLVYSPLVLITDKNLVEVFQNNVPQNDVFMDINFQIRLYFRYSPTLPDTAAPYEIKKTEESEFCAFWEEFLGLPGENFALDRFLEADYRLNPKDCITDYVEALEFLLVPDSNGGEISFKFRSRGALIIGRNESATAKKKIFEDFKHAYDIRSAIVHGDENRIKNLGKKKNWEEVIGTLRKHTREAIKYFFKEDCLDDNKSRTDLIQDKTIFEPCLY